MDIILLDSELNDLKVTLESLSFRNIGEWCFDWNTDDYSILCYNTHFDILVFFPRINELWDIIEAWSSRTQSLQHNGLVLSCIKLTGNTFEFVLQFERRCVVCDRCGNHWDGNAQCDCSGYEYV